MTTTAKPRYVLRQADRYVYVFRDIHTPGPLPVDYAITRDGFWGTR